MNTARVSSRFWEDDNCYASGESLVTTATAFSIATGWTATYALTYDYKKISYPSGSTDTTTCNGDVCVMAYTKSTVSSSVPAKPTNLTLTSGNRKIVAKWSSVSGATGYEVWYKKSGDSDYSLFGKTSSTKTTVKNPVNGEWYFFKVYAYNSYGKSSLRGYDSKIPRNLDTPTIKQNSLYASEDVNGNDENRLPVVDEPAASVVRRIFEMRSQSISPRHIADTLNAEGVPTASDYMYSKLGKPNPRKTSHFRSAERIRALVNNPTYLGHLVQMRTTTVSYKNHKHIKKDPSEWTVVENTPEPLVSQEIWDKYREVEASVSQGKRLRTDL